MGLFKHQQGFTLIELLIVIAIIGILAGIAIPSFIIYRSSGFAAQVISDVKNASTAEEAVYLDTNGYTDVVADLINVGYNQNSKVTLAITTTSDGFILTATHTNCGTSTWTLDSLLNSGITGGPCVP